MTKSQVLRVAFFLVSLGLSACSTTHLGGQRDGAPTRQVDVSKIDNARPEVVRRTKAGNKSPYTVLGKTYRVMDDATGFKQSGIASWYGTKFHGRLTSNGETYDMFAMTAAHKSIPIPSYVKVSNPANGQSVVVRVNDRGPFHGGRIIDLSFAAAKKLGYADDGTARVELEVITPAGQSSGIDVPSRPSSDPYTLPANTYLQLGAFGRIESAEALVAKISELVSHPVRIRLDKLLYKVQLGPISNNQVMLRLRKALQSENLATPHVVYD